MGKAAKYGAVAAVGGLAYHAWNQHRQKQAGAQGQAAPAQDPTQQSAGSVPAIEAEYDAAPANSAFLPAQSDEAAQDA